MRRLSETRLAKHDELASRKQADNEMHFNASLVTYGDAPGYRDVCFTFDLDPKANPRPPFRTSISIPAEDSERVVDHITDVDRSVRDRGIGAQPFDGADEQRPRCASGVVLGPSFLSRRDDPVESENHIDLA
jgi:hypothetical protein